MNNLQSSIKNHEESSIHIKALKAFFKKAAADESEYIALCKDPLDILEAQGVFVEEEYRESVSLQMKSVAAFASLGAGEPAYQEGTNLQGFFEVASDFQFLVQPWGVVLVVGEPGMKYLEAGGGITAGILGGAAGVAAIPAAPLGAVLGVASAALGVYFAGMKAIDQGNGVYLTWTWVQFWPFLPIPPIPNPMFGVPVYTAI
ncbi:hypothetical protein [Desulforhopalus sp. 52FAK]